MPLEELLSMYGYNFDECAPEVLNVDENVSDASKLAEASVPKKNEISGDSSDHSSKTRSKLRYLRDNHHSDSSKRINYSWHFLIEEPIWSITFFEMNSNYSRW